jgi:FkbM family methyltransferase
VSSLSTIKRAFLRMIPTAVAGRLRAWRVRRMIATYDIRTVEHRYGAGNLRVQLVDPLSAGWYDHDWAELPEIAALRGRCLRAGARVFDVGAHQGIVALMLAREIGPSGQVVAVEPNPHNAAAAMTNRDLNQLHQVEILEAAVSDRSGTLIFSEGLDGQLDDGSGSSGRMTVVSTTVDALAARFGMPDLVMIDAEGAECLVLAGAQRVLASTADFAVEVHVGCGLEKLGGSVDRLLASFPPNRYTVLARSEADEAFRPVTTDDPLTRDRFFLLALATPVPEGRC